MELPAQGWMRCGHFLVRWSGAEAPGDEEHLLDLSSAGDRLNDWWRAGGPLGIRPISQRVHASQQELQQFQVLAAGPGAPMPALAALALGVATVRIVLEPKDADAFQAAAAMIRPTGDFVCLDGLEEAPAHVHRLCLLGCAGTAPTPQGAAAMVSSLLPEGQLILFGLPQTDLRATFENFAARGFSLQGSGVEDGLAYLSGQLQNVHRFQT